MIHGIGCENHVMIYVENSDESPCIPINNISG